MFVALMVALAPILGDQPNPHDRLLFPAASVCAEQLKANRRYQDQLEMLIEDADEGDRLLYLYLLAETRRRWVIWWWAEDCTLPEQVRFKGDWALRRLRHHLGPADYHAGRLPPAVPIDFWPWK